jgi:hypothetical protein
MATVSYTFVSRCSGGGHTTLGVSFNGGATQNVVYTTDEINQPLSGLTQDQRETLALLILKVHMAGKTRAQMVSEFQSPVTVTI